MAYKIDSITANTIESKSITLNGEPVGTKTYEVYSALLSQAGDGSSTQTTGPLIIGARYEIVTYFAGDDFSNVAKVVSGIINTNGCQFIATGTTPTNYSNGTQLRDTSAPIATVLENTLGDIVWGYINVGEYSISSANSSFKENKTQTIVQLWADDSVSPRTGGVYRNSSDLLTLFCREYNGVATNIIGGTQQPVIILTSIEIRVYN